MDDQLDNDLKKRIAEVFENYEDTSADEGWLLLREKYPGKGKRRIAAWIWWAPAAALLLLFLGILWFKQAPQKQQQMAGATKKIQPNSKPQTIVEAKRDVIKDSSVTHRSEQALTSKTSGLNTKTRSPQQPSNAVTSKNDNENIVAAIKPNSASKLTNKISTVPVPNNTQNQNTLPLRPALTAAVQPEDQVPGQSTLRKEIIAKSDSGANGQAKTSAVAAQTGVNMEDQQKNKGNKQIFADNEGSKKTEKKDEDKIVRFGVYATTYFNYAKGSSSQFNIGAGFTSDIKLSKKLKISTGLSIGQNSLSYVNQFPQVSEPAIAASRLTLYSASSLYSVPPPAFKNYNASLVGLDIPLNLKFTFNPQKSETYILAGLSSGTFINETYTYSYSNPSFFTADVSQVQNQSTKNSFNGFYFAKTLNLALGTGYRIGRNRLEIEPFLKYPLEGLGTQQIRFGAGGVNLKFNLQGQKK